MSGGIPQDLIIALATVTRAGPVGPQPGFSWRWAAGRGQWHGIFGLVTVKSRGPASQQSEWTVPSGRECPLPTAQLRSSTLSRAACRVRWSRSGRLGADRAASA
jgi:hypothetical protein